MLEDVLGEDAASILRDKDQMDMHQEYAVSSAPNIIFVAHSPRVNSSSMKRLQAFKFELRPDGEQRRQLTRFAGSCQFVFNKALALQKSKHEAGAPFVGCVAMAKYLTEWRNGTDTPWLKQAPIHPLQHALKGPERAYQNFFAKRARFPRFKRKGQAKSFRYPDARQFRIDQLPAQHESQGEVQPQLAQGEEESSEDSQPHRTRAQGGEIIPVPAHHTSRTCPVCQHVATENRRSQARFHCVQCGYEHHADVVGAINILERGVRSSACGEEGAGLARKRKTQPASKKQEPAEETHAIAV
jgi:transposase